MNNFARRVSLFAIASFAIVAVAGAARPDTAAVSVEAATEAGKRWWSHIQVLADDKMEGRNVGTPGYQMAADYVSARFKEYGLEPGANGSYFQPVRFAVQKLDLSQASVTLTRDGQTQPLAIGSDILVSAGVPEPQEVTGQLVFIGYGLHIPEANYDDFKDLDLKGKILVYLNGGPNDISAPLKSNARSSAEFWAVAEKAGAVGRISIANPKSMDIPWSRMTANVNLAPTGMWLADANLQDTKSPKFSGAFNPGKADMLFAGTGHTMDELLALADAGKPLPRFAIPVSVTAKVKSEMSYVDSMNVVGIRPGSDRKLKAEYVVLSGHLDHIGKRNPPANAVATATPPDLINNGAMDDGSGIATILEVARALHQSKAKLKRSVIFLAVTGEEKGLLGSRYFAGNPTVPKQQLVADLNTDMFLPLYPLNSLIVLGLDESTLGESVRQVGAKVGVAVQRDPQPDRNAFIRSDQFSFIRAGVPAIAMKVGFQPGSPQEKVNKDWLAQRYHNVSDDLQQPVDLESAGRFNLLLTDLATTIANDRQRPKWNDTSFFKRFADGK
ncbi:MAG TPA: M28 family metallopeptidase [Terriglobales bacterium]|nr:M28 family metallopeptidase [Terriglobales bacterium]